MAKKLHPLNPPSDPDATNQCDSATQQ